MAFDFVYILFLRIFEPTQGVCVQSEELEEPISLHSYHFHNYDKFLISTGHNIYLPEVGNVHCIFQIIYL